jgi:hypothetical protein
MIPLPLLASRILVDAILNATFLELVTRGARVTSRSVHATPLGTEPISPWTRLCTDDDPIIRIPLERWIVDVIAEIVESRKASRIRMFVRNAVLVYLDQITAEGLDATS